MEINEIIKEKMGIIEKEYAAKYNVRVCIDYTYTIDNIDNDCPITPFEFIDIVAFVLGISKDLLKSKIRTNELVDARFICFEKLYNFYNWPLAKIGKYFGNRHHATVIHGKTLFDNLMKSDKKFIAKVQKIEKHFENLKTLNKQQ